MTEGQEAEAEARGVGGGVGGSTLAPCRHPFNHDKHTRPTDTRNIHGLKTLTRTHTRHRRSAEYKEGRKEEEGPIKYLEFKKKKKKEKGRMNREKKEKNGREIRRDGKRNNQNKYVVWAKRARLVVFQQRPRPCHLASLSFHSKAANC